MLVKPGRMWWRIKVVVGSLLIALLVENYTLGSFAVMWQPWVWAGQLLTIVGGSCAIWHYRLLRRAAGCIDEPQLLVTGGGLYSRIRHPMYLGDCVMYLGLFMLAPGLPGLLLLCAGWFALSRQADAEDRAMKNAFPSAYEAWVGASGKLLPKLQASSA